MGKNPWPFNNAIIFIVVIFLILIVDIISQGVVVGISVVVLSVNIWS
jgi:hypothetical protein